MARGDLTPKQRDDAAPRGRATTSLRHVLYDNFLQAQILSQEVGSSAEPGRGVRGPDGAARGATGCSTGPSRPSPRPTRWPSGAAPGAGWPRPELGVLLAYSKRASTDQLLPSSLARRPRTSSATFARYFPRPVVERFGDLLPEHPLRRELTATIVANEVVNSQGITFVSRFVAETGADAGGRVRAPSGSPAT